MTSWRQQALIEAPVEDVWRCVGDPATYPEWAHDVVEVTGIPEVERDATFRQVSRSPFRHETTFRIEELEELRQIKMRCEESGLFSRWLLTEAQESTFVDVEFGIDPTRLRYRAVDATIGKRWYRRLADQAIDGLKGELGRRK